CCRLWRSGPVGKPLLPPLPFSCASRRLLNSLTRSFAPEWRTPLFRAENTLPEADVRPLKTGVANGKVFAFCRPAVERPPPGNSGRGRGQGRGYSTAVLESEAGGKIPRRARRLVAQLVGGGPGTGNGLPLLSHVHALCTGSARGG